MKLFVTGGTGALGRPTVPALLDAGHTVRAVARDEAKAARLRDVGAEPVIVDVFDADAVDDAVEGSEAILHLATSIPPVTKAARRSAWRVNNRLRTEATSHLLAAARRHGVERFVKESITFTYVDRGDEWIDESTPVLEPAGMLQPTLDGERMVTGFTAAGGAGVVLRFGLFYGPHNRANDEVRRLARLRQAPISGPGDSYMSSLHTDDAAQAVGAALDAPPGIYNVVDDEPMTRRAYVDAYSAACGLPRLHLTPPLMLRMLAGGAGRALTASQRVSNAHFKETTGWQPVYRNAQDGWVAVASALDTEEQA